MTNVEALYGLTKENIEILEDVDKVLLRKIFSSHSKCPSEAFYLELGILPIKYIVKGRRLIFLPRLSIYRAPRSYNAKVKNK